MSKTRYNDAIHGLTPDAEVPDVDWTSVFDKLKLDPSSREYLEARLAGKTQPQIAELPTWSPAKVENTRKRTAYRIEQAAEVGDFERRKSTRRSLNPIRRRRGAGGVPIYEPLRLTEDNFASVMRAEVVQPVESKHFLRNMSVYERRKMKQQVTEPTIRQAVQDAIEQAPSTAPLRESQKWLRSLVVELNRRRDEFREAKLEFAKGREINLLGSEAYLLVRTGPEAENPYHRHAELAKVVDALPSEIAKLEAAVRLQSDVTARLRELQEQEVSVRIRPIHDRIAQDLDRAMLALSAASQAELDLLATLNDCGIRHSPAIQPLALAGFNQSNESKHFGWREFARQNGYSNVVELPVATREARKAS